RLPISELLREEHLGGRVDRAAEHVEIERAQEALDRPAALGCEILGRSEYERLQLLVGPTGLERGNSGGELDRIGRAAQEGLEDLADQCPAILIAAEDRLGDLRVRSALGEERAEERELGARGSPAEEVEERLTDEALDRRYRARVRRDGAAELFALDRPHGHRCHGAG